MGRREGYTSSRQETILKIRTKMCAVFSSLDASGSHHLRDQCVADLRVSVDETGPPGSHVGRPH